MGVNRTLPDDRSQSFFEQLRTPAQLLSLLDNLPATYFFAKDLHGSFVHVNQALIDVLGLNDESEVLGKTDYDLFPPEVAAQYRAHDQAVIDSGEALNNHVCAVPNSAGVLRWYVETKIPLTDVNGKTVGVAGVMYDLEKAGALLEPYERLNAAITHINSVDKNIITVEDPVEYQLRGIGQIQVHPKIGLSFASGLRSILRQDPDVILVGEVRDLETAEIAIQASLTGHLVFSTLHTNDAPGAITRLIDMGVEPFLVSSSLLGVLAQRLVRTICSECRETYRPLDSEVRELGLDPADLPEHGLYRGAGCATCMRTGYRGRTGIYELLTFSDAIRSAVLERTDSSTIRRVAMGEGMITLRRDGIRKVLTGMTTIEEVVRVTQDVM